jgi:uncharacterized protein
MNTSLGPWTLAILGGILLALSTTGLLAFNGQIAGVGGAFARVVHPFRAARGWQLLFVLGLVAGGAIVFLLAPARFALDGPPRSTGALIASGLLMGIGGRMANGCMSGHCICGISRLAKRSLVASALFMGSAAATVFIITRFFGGRL